MVNGKKFLAMLLIFTMTFSNFAFVTKSFATTGFISIFGANSKAENDEVIWEAFLTNGEETSNAMVSDVNNENLFIKMGLNIEKGGYLKNGKVEMKTNDDQKPNFVIKEGNQVEEIAGVQSLENNVVYLNKVENSSDKLEISMPIEYEQEEYINEAKLCQSIKMILSGVYVNEDGEENEISKEAEVTLAWKDERAVKVENEVSKYIQFGNGGIILQTIVRVDHSNPDKNSLPAKTTQLNIDVPKINDIAPAEVTVIANSTAGTNGKGVGEVEFSNENWNYNKEESRVNIQVDNNKQFVNVNQSEEYLKVEGEEPKQEERYYSQAGMDEYLVTYTFQNIEIAEEMKVSSKVEAKLTTFSGVQADEHENIVTAEDIKEFVLTGQTGNIVSYDIENETKEVSKIFGYLNKETEFDTKTSINISYKEIVEEMMVEDIQNYYIDKAGNKIEADDMYYKQISVSKENFNEILGEEGKLEVLDTSGNTLAIINQESATDENGNYVVNFQDRQSKIVVKTSAPINTGNLIITNRKAVSNISLDKAEYANMEYIATNTVQKAKFEYVSELTDLGNCTVKTKLNDTTTNFNLIVDRESLSTVTPNTNVEMRLELNNDEITSDIYGNSIFEIEMPEYITSLNVTNVNMIYEEGLKIRNVETFVRDGKVMIKVNVEGKQTELNSGVLTNGTNIVINADINIDQYTPSLDKTIKAYCYNSEATNYANAAEYIIEDSKINAYQEAKIEYTAPSGLFTINTIANYDALGKSVTSIKQGEKVDYIDIYSQAKNATMEVVVVNNNENEVSNLAILGRIPFEGVKDLSTGNDLGTTLDTKMVTGIVPNETNLGDFTVYYSENKEANQNLSDASNGWVTNPESLDNIKSYLIVPSDGNYKMEAKQVLKFTYEYEIPENLAHNENIYGTFQAYYTNNTEVATTDETAKPDLVGLTTGAGPELNLEVQTENKEVKELEEFKTTITVKNTGADVSNDVVVNIPIPEHTSFVVAEANRESTTVEFREDKIVATVGQLAKDASVDIMVTLKVDHISEYDSNKIQVTASANAKDLQKELMISGEEITIKRAEFSVEQYMDLAKPDDIFKKGTTLNFIISAQNLTEEVRNNVKVETQLPKELDFVKAYMVGENASHIENATYDESTHKVTWTIDTINAEEAKYLKLDVTVGNLDSGMTAKGTVLSTHIFAEGTDTYAAEQLEINLGKGSISVTLNSSTPTYVTEGEIINYTFSIKNEGGASASDVLLTDIVPDGVIIRKVAYSLEGEENVSTMSETELAELELTIPANSQVDVDVTALASSLDGAKEKTVTNEGTISSSEIEEVKSNSVTHIIQAKERIEEESSTNEGAISSENNNNNNSSSKDITKSYKITGTAWLDANENGMRDENETRMSNVTAMLVDSSSGIIKATVQTNQNGEYTFAGVQNGSYLVLFKYDTVLYTTTTYRKEGVETNINSDVVTTKIEQDGRKENGAVTDVISVNGANVSNIDIGLIEAEKFSLSLDKSISKVTVQNSQGTKTEEFDKTKLAKYDIGAKQLAGTTVYIEYTLTVTNNGDLEGFASEIVDYIPQGMTFNSKLNPDWYTGTDGNLYTKALADTEIAKGESKEIKLVLTKQMTAENTGLVSNTAEIAEDYNVYGVSDNNSKPANKAQGEDDMSTADTILTVKTGESLIYVSAMIVSLLIGSAVAFVVYERVIKTKRKGGV